ncbi:MAG: hypothetical protein R3F34_01985 [Planctomycetota bacterium]
MRLDGRDVRPGAEAVLYVMLHDLTDALGEEHWEYGVVTPGGEVRAAGRVASCSACHASAPFGGLFGEPSRAAR